MAGAALLIAGCGGSGAAQQPSIAVGAGHDAESSVLAHVYAAALRSYGTPAHVEQSGDPLAGLDTGDVEVVPGFTGQLLQRFDPGATSRAGNWVYRTMISTLPEGVAAGDYAQSADDEPALAVTEKVAGEWGRRDVSALVDHCGGLRVGAVAGSRPPAAVASCQIPVSREFSSTATLFAALRSGQVNAAWISTATPDTPDDVVVLGDRTALIRAENVVPLYRRNVLTERQVLALNEIAGELDTASLTDMLRRVTAGSDPGAVASEWLDAHPLGH